VKIGVLSDIHGNADALAAVLKAVSGLGIRKLLCAGDYVGYYYEPDTCLRLLGDHDVESVRGNHEDMLAALVEQPSLAPGVRQRYGSGLSEAVRRLTASELAALAALPHSRRVEAAGRTILLCHGSPWDPNDYLYPDAPDDVLDRCASEGADYVVVGHTHCQFAKRIGSTLILNPGSVGQPRDRRPGAAWAVLDTDSQQCSLRLERYDTAPIEARARATDPHLPYLWEVLSRC
jgi:putative phosphoesterase